MAGGRRDSHSPLVVADDMVPYMVVDDALVLQGIQVGFGMDCLTHKAVVDSQPAYHSGIEVGIGSDSIVVSLDEPEAVAVAVEEEEAVVDQDKLSCMSRCLSVCA